MGSFVLVGTAAGVRFLWRAVRERDGAMALIGAALLLCAGVGGTLTTAAGAASPALGPWLWGAGLAAINLGASALYLFNWLVFHRRARRFALLAALGWIALWGGFSGQAAATGFEVLFVNEGWGFVSLFARAAAFGWASLVAWQEFRTAQRCVALGITRPIVAKRFFWLSVASGAAFGVFAMNFVRNLAGGADPASFWSLGVVPMLGLTAAIGIQLAFFPPQRYRAYIEARG